MLAANHIGSCSAITIRARPTAPVYCPATTISFLLRASSRNGLHRGLKAQASPSRPVQRAIWSLDTPMFLNIRPAISMTTKNCMPCTKYRLDTQRIGLRGARTGWPAAVPAEAVGDERMGRTSVRAARTEDFGTKRQRAGINPG